MLSVDSAWDAAPSARDRRDQFPSIVAARRLENLPDRAGLDHPAGPHDGDGVGDQPHHRQVVRDEQVGQAEIALQLVEQRQDLRLHGDVERRDGLVQHQHAGVEEQRAGDRHALPLAARERAAGWRESRSRGRPVRSVIAGDAALPFGRATGCEIRAAVPRRCRPPSGAGRARHRGSGRPAAPGGGTAAAPRRATGATSVRPT